jgi:hypothetical protein
MMAIVKENYHIYDVQEFEGGGSCKNIIGNDINPFISVENDAEAKVVPGGILPLIIKCKNYDGEPYEFTNEEPIYVVTISGPANFSETFELESEGGIVELDFSAETQGNYIFEVYCKNFPCSTGRKAVEVIA